VSLDTAEDVVVDAFCALARSEVTRLLADLTNVGDEPVEAVLETRAFPAPLDLVEATALPAMTIYRSREVEIQKTMRHRDSRTTLVFVYTAPETALDKLGPRWPILRTVWRALLEAISVGEVGEVGGRVNVLAGVGVTAIDIETASVVYDASVTPEGLAFPQFRGEITIEERPVVVSELVDLRELFARINRPDGNPAIQPQVEVLARTPAGERAVEGSGDPLDPDSEDA
jgi:hypothetical protein